jgi:hypothetical protein
VIRRGAKVSAVSGKTFTERVESFHKTIPGKAIYEIWKASWRTRYLANVRYVPRIFGRGRIRPQGDVIFVMVK